jgi:hypothetical protein
MDATRSQYMREPYVAEEQIRNAMFCGFGLKLTGPVRFVANAKAVHLCNHNPPNQMLVECRQLYILLCTLSKPIWYTCCWLVTSTG